MKTHPHLLVRDALAELFVEAASGKAEALAGVGALARWAEGGEGGASLAPIRVEDGRGLFAAGGLDPAFAPLEAYVRDRARRFRTACEWIAASGAAADPLERARAAWDAGLFFEVHEILEPVWLEERGPGRDLLQALIMAGAALHHLSGGNRAGARGLLRDAARRLETAPDDARFDWRRLGRELLALAGEIERGRIGSLDDLADVPRWVR